MKHKKMMLALLLTMILTLGLLSPAVFAQERDSPGLVIAAESVTTQPGATVEVPVKITSNPGFVTMDVSITYDPEKLTLTGVEMADGFPVASDTVYIGDDAGKGGFVVDASVSSDPMASVADLMGTGLLATLTFTVAGDAEGVYDVGLTVDSAVNTILEPVTASAVNGVVTVQPAASQEPNIDNKTGTTPTASVTAPAAGWTDGANTFTVSNMVDGKDVACVVLIKDGDTYTRLTATNNNDGTYSFTTPDAFDLSEHQIVIAVKGDVTGDGKVNVADRMALARSLLASDDDNRLVLEGPAPIIADVTGDGKVNVADRMALARSLLASDDENRLVFSW